MSDPQAILIVDDRRENLVALERTLSELDATIVRAGDGNEALRATLNHDFALCLLDVQMPGMDGYELARILRADGKTRLIPIIFLTAAVPGEQEVLEGYEAGGVDYLIKPYNPLVLRSKVQTFLDLARQRVDLQRQHTRLELLTTQLQEEIEARGRAEQQIRQQAEALVELSTPVIKVWDRILVVPLIGTVDSLRATQLVEQLLQATATYQAAVVIIDVTGVGVVDSQVAAALLSAARGARLLGAQSVITGINPEVAQTLIRSGVSLPGIASRRTLQDALRLAFQLTGQRVTDGR